MELLYAILMFSLLMIVFSTVVTGLVEALHRQILSRESGFKSMMVRYYDEVLHRRYLLDASCKADFISATTENLGDGKIQADTNSELFTKLVQNNFLISILRRLFLSPQVEHLTPEEFIRRLSQTKAGLQISKKTKENTSAVPLKNVIRDLATAFNAYGNGARKHYADRASALSFALALILAFTANINPYRLFNSFIDNPNGPRIIIENNDVSVLKNKKIKEKIDASIELYLTTDDRAAEAKAKQSLDSITKKSRQLTEVNIPVGTKYFPYCGEGSSDLLCKTVESELEQSCRDIAKKDTDSYGRENKAPEDNTGKKSAVEKSDAPASPISKCVDENWVSHLLTKQPWDLVSWFAWTSFAAFLIGLGAPFWFLVYSRSAKWVSFIAGAKRRTEPALDTETTATAKPASELDLDELTAMFSELVMLNETLPSMERN